MSIEELIICIILILIFVFGCLLYRLFQFDRFENIFSKVGWIAERDKRTEAYKAPVHLRDEELLYYILQEEHNMEIPSEYHINLLDEIEKSCVEEILSIHRKYIITCYFSGFINISKDCRKLNSLEYYMFSLFNYLDEELSSTSSTLRDKIYNYDRSDDTYRFYKLTPFGRACYKIHLIATTFVKSNEKTKSLYTYIKPYIEKNDMDYLEKNEVCFWKY